MANVRRVPTPSRYIEYRDTADQLLREASADLKHVKQKDDSLCQQVELTTAAAQAWAILALAEATRETRGSNDPQ